MCTCVCTHARTYIRVHKPMEEQVSINQNSNRGSGFGFGSVDVGKTRDVLEVRSHDVPFLVEQDQIVCRLVYEPMSETPKSLYGAMQSVSNYQSQGLKLAKHFK